MFSFFPSDLWPTGIQRFTEQVERYSKVFLKDITSVMLITVKIVLFYLILYHKINNYIRKRNLH